MPRIHLFVQLGVLYILLRSWPCPALPPLGAYLAASFLLFSFLRLLLAWFIVIYGLVKQTETQDERLCGTVTSISLILMSDQIAGGRVLPLSYNQFLESFPTTGKKFFLESFFLQYAVVPQSYCHTFKPQPPCSYACLLFYVKICTTTWEFCHRNQKLRHSIFRMKNNNRTFSDLTDSAAFQRQTALISTCIIATQLPDVARKCDIRGARGSTLPVMGKMGVVSLLRMIDSHQITFCNARPIRKIKRQNQSNQNTFAADRFC